MTDQADLPCIYNDLSVTGATLFRCKLTAKHTSQICQVYAFSTSLTLTPQWKSYAFSFLTKNNIFNVTSVLLLW